MPLPRALIRLVLAGRDAPLELVEALRAEVAAVSPHVLSARMRAALSVDASDDARACPVPALYLGARDERLLRRGLAAELRALLPSLEVLELPAPHLVLQRAPVESAAAVASFLARLVCR
ncbi:MAG: alpha/beta fold hydrolase [Myxococcota bacterium]